MTPVPFAQEDVPAGMRRLVWQGDGRSVADAEAVFCEATQRTIFRLEVTDSERVLLAAGGPVYLVVVGRVAPFAATAHYDAAVRLVAQEG